MSNSDKFKSKKRRLRLISFMGVLATITVGFFIFNDVEDKPTPLSHVSNDIENGIHVKTGFIEAEGMKTVITHCTACHSSQLVIQNRMNEERWNETIKWMQETQNLWDLGEHQEVIVNYLVKNYPPTETGRRENLGEIEWYHLNE